MMFHGSCDVINQKIDDEHANGIYDVTIDLFIYTISRCLFKDNNNTNN